MEERGCFLFCKAVPAARCLPAAGGGVGLPGQPDDRHSDYGWLSPTTVACFVMAKNMKADSVLTSNAVLLSTLLSALSITFWLYWMRAFGWI